jgi:hypothetical protein
VGGAILIVWTDIPADIEDDFNDWYDREHLPDRVGRLPGFLRGRRFVRGPNEHADDAPKYLTYYDLASAGVMQSDAHKALRRERPARDKIFVPRFRNTIKGICDVVCRDGNGAGGSEYLVLLPVAASRKQEPSFAQRACAALLPRLAALPGVTSAVIARRNAAVTQASSAGDDRAGDRYLDGLIAVEADSANAAAQAAALLDAKTLVALGGKAEIIPAPCVLRHRFGLQAG